MGVNLRGLYKESKDYYIKKFLKELKVCNFRHSELPMVFIALSNPNYRDSQWTIWKRQEERVQGSRQRRLESKPSGLSQHQERSWEKEDKKRWAWESRGHSVQEIQVRREKRCQTSEARAAKRIQE